MCKTVYTCEAAKGHHICLVGMLWPVSDKVSGQTKKQQRLFTFNIFQYIGMLWRVSDKVSRKAKKQQRLCASNILAPGNAEDKVQ